MRNNANTHGHSNNNDYASDGKKRLSIFTEEPYQKFHRFMMYTEYCECVS